MPLMANCQTPRPQLMRTLLPLALLATTSLASAVVIGVEDFSYADGAIDGQTGGTGFDYNNLTDTATGSTSDWDNTGGVPTVSSGKLVTNNTSAKREHNGPGEGAGGADIDTEERSGALRGAGQVFYSVEITRNAGATWSGVSTYDFGAELIFFGVPGTANPGSGNLEWGVQIAGTPTHYYSGIAADNNTHTIVAVLDYDNDQIGLWLDPTGADFYNNGDGTNSADAIGAFAASNWATAARLGSGGSASTEWDDLTIATEFVDIIPEPSTTLLGGLMALFLFRRQR